MPGVREISDVVEALQRAERTSLHVLPLHGQLSSAAQREVFKRPRAGLTKVVVATNVAEASVTIDDIGYVIDAGVHKVGSPFTPLIPPFSPHSRHARVRARARTIALSLSLCDWRALLRSHADATQPLPRSPRPRFHFPRSPDPVGYPLPGTDASEHVNHTRHRKCASTLGLV